MEEGALGTAEMSSNRYTKPNYSFMQLTSMEYWLLLLYWIKSTDPATDKTNEHQHSSKLDQLYIVYPSSISVFKLANWTKLGLFNSFDPKGTREWLKFSGDIYNS